MNSRILGGLVILALAQLAGCGEADATITESPEVAGTDDNRENGSSPPVLRIIVLALAVILVGAAVSVVLLRKRSRIR